MEGSVGIYKFKQGLVGDTLSLFSKIGRNDVCFFRFAGGNMSETDKLAEQLFHLRATGAFVLGVFRFPFRYEGKKRLQTAIVQYHRMKELCDAITYIDADGMLSMVNDRASMEEAYEAFDWMEEGPARAVEELIATTGQINIDVHDIRTFLTGAKGAVYIRSFEGDSFDEPLKYVLNAPYLPADYTEGQQIIMNIGCSKDVDMLSFHHMSLRLNDLFHKCELFKLGTYFLDEPGHRFKITLMVNGIAHPYPRPESMPKWNFPKMWLKRQWTSMVVKGAQQVPVLQRADAQSPSVEMGLTK